MKKIISLVIIFLLIFSLVSCKSHGSDEETAYPKKEETPAEFGNIIDIVPDETEDTVNNNNTTTDNQQPTDEQVTPENKPDDNVTDNTHVDVTDENPVNDSDPKQPEENKINQVELESQPYIESLIDTLNYKFDSVDEMVDSIKSGEYNGWFKETDVEYWDSLQDEHLKSGKKGHVGHSIFETDKIKCIYKIKDIPGYKLTEIFLNSSFITYFYQAESDPIDSEYEFIVRYHRPENFVTDSYFDDHIEYYKIGKENIMDDKYVYTNYGKSGHSSIMFAVENTVIHISGRNEFISYEALKELCVPEKVVIR